MDNDQENQQKSEIKPIDATIRSLKDMDKHHAKESFRRIVDGALAGTCVVFIAALIGLQSIDMPLHVALFSFVIALPFLSHSFLNVYEDKADAPRPFLVLVAHRVGLMCEAAGEVAVVVGFSSILLHFSTSLLVVFLSVGLFIILLSNLSMTISIVFSAVREYRKKQKTDRERAEVKKDEALTQNQEQ